MTTTPGTDVAVFDISESAFPVLFAGQEGGDSELAELLEDNLDGGDINMGDLIRLTVPSGGGRVWELPGSGDDEDDVQAQRFVSGVVINRQKTRSMWFKQKGAGGEDTQPDCSSDDAVTGIGVFGVGSEQHPSGECGPCPMNQWESARPVDGQPQKGKGCKEQLQIWFLPEGAILPIQVTLPPTSLKAWRQYTTQLLGNNQSVYGVVTRFALKVESSNGNDYSVVTPSVLRPLSKEERVAAKRYGADIKARLEAQAKARRDAEALAAGATDAGSPAGDIWNSDLAAEATADEAPAPKAKAKG